MKIGVLTVPFNNNYGGYLQAFALISILKSMGHDVVLINRRHPNFPLSWRVKHFVRNFVKVCLFRKVECVILSRDRIIRKKGRRMLGFVCRHIPRTKPIYSSKQLEKVSKKAFDVVVFGSDQLWRPDYVPNIADYYGSFLKDVDVRRISYAASFGNAFPVYTEEERHLCGMEISKFHAISLREKSGIDVIKNMEWNTVKPTVVLDPTMLMDAAFYNSKISAAKSPSANKIFCYVLDQSPDVQKIVKKLSSALNLSEYHIIDSAKWQRMDYIMPSIEDWLSGIRDAEFVLTDSFHGTVFSILFKKPFIVCVNENRGAERFYTLLEHFNLTNRIACNEDDALKLLQESIDWKDVDEKMDVLRKRSMEFLIAALEK